MIAVQDTALGLHRAIHRGNYQHIQLYANLHTLET